MTLKVMLSNALHDRIETDMRRSGRIEEGVSLPDDWDDQKLTFWYHPDDLDQSLIVIRRIVLPEILEQTLARINEVMTEPGWDFLESHIDADTTGAGAVNVMLGASTSADEKPAT
jgi:hypothetical protein